MDEKTTTDYQTIRQLTNWSMTFSNHYNFFGRYTDYLQHFYRVLTQVLLIPKVNLVGRARVWCQGPFFLDKALLFGNWQVAQALRAHSTRANGEDQPTIAVPTKTTAILVEIVTNMIMADRVMGDKILTELAILIERC